MIMTGYVFDSSSEILPHLELPDVGPTSQFCKELANRLCCYVIAGYPERLVGDEAPSDEPDGEEKQGSKSLEPENDVNQVALVKMKEEKPRIVGANSAVLYGPGGNLLAHYRKTNLFETDKTWAKPGTGFITVPLRFPPHTSPSSRSSILNVSLGICMDLNVQSPATWSLQEGPYELAQHVIAEKVDILVLLNAWLGSNVDPGSLHESDYATLHYWSQRLRPLWAPPNFKGDDWMGEEDYDIDDEESIDSEEYEDPCENDYDYEVREYEFGDAWTTPSRRERSETVVIICNRTGKEKGKLFAGSSCIFHMKRNSGRPNMFESMGRYDEGVKGWGILL